MSPVLSLLAASDLVSVTSGQYQAEPAQWREALRMPVRSFQLINKGDSGDKK